MYEFRIFYDENRVKYLESVQNYTSFSFYYWMEYLSTTDNKPFILQCRFNEVGNWICVGYYWKGYAISEEFFNMVSNIKE